MSLVESRSTRRTCISFLIRRYSVREATQHQQHFPNVARGSQTVTAIECRRATAPKRPWQVVHCSKGASALEFAVCVPLLFVAVAATIELAMIMFVSTLMEGGLREAARFGITGYSPAGISREDRIRQVIGEHTIGLIDMQNATIVQHVYPGFDDIGKPEPFDDLNGNGVYDSGEPFQDINGNGQWDADMGAAGVGGPGDVVLYTVAARWAALTPLITPLLGIDGGIELRASVAVRNEPYDLLMIGGGGTP